MSLGQLTKQFALEALRPADAAAVADTLAEERRTVPGPSDNLAATIVGQVQAMQNALKDDQELIVLCTAGSEMLRVLEFFTPSPRLLVLTGIDSERTVTRVISPVETLQLVCKPMSVKQGAKPARIRFVAPRPKNE